MNKGWPSLLWFLWNFDGDQAGSYFGGQEANRSLHALYALDTGKVTLDNLTNTTQSGLSVESKVYNLSGTVTDDRTASNLSLTSQQVMTNVLTPTVPTSPAGTTYFVELQLKQNGTLIDRNVYWLSTTPDATNWNKSLGNPVGSISTYANLTGLRSLATIPSSSIAVTASTATQSGPAGADRATTVTITNNSSSVAFLLRADVRRGTGTTPAAGDNELQSSIWQNNDITLFPGESQSIVVTWNSSDLQGLSPIISLSGWNTPTQNVAGVKEASVKHRYRYWLVAAATPALVVAGLAGTPAYAAYTPLPAHVYAPYYETYLAPSTPSLTATAQASGVRYFSLAFLQATAKGSCTVNWNSNASQPLNYYNSDIASLRALGGDVITDIRRLQRRPRRHRDRRYVHRRQLDRGRLRVGDHHPRRHQARHGRRIKLAEQHRRHHPPEPGAGDRAAWAAAQSPPIPLQVSYTIPVEQYGLDPNGEAVLQSAVANGVKVTTVNIMVFDYYIAKEGTVEMGQAAINAANNTSTQLQSIFGVTSQQAYAMEGMTLLPGIDDRKQKNEVTNEPDATTMLNFAQANNLNELSIWAIQRDNGGCPGSVDSNTCSGITQNTWDFSHLLEPFTG